MSMVTAWYMDKGLQPNALHKGLCAKVEIEEILNGLIEF